MSKIVILGIPGFTPALAQLSIEDLPNLKRMQEEGIWGKMQSTVPPHIATAWTCALSGRNPGAFGFWNFSYRDTFTYGEPKSIGTRIKDQRVNSLYTILPNLGQKVAILGVPVTSPPPRIPGGCSISDVLTQDLEKGYTWPKSLADEIRGLVGEFILDGDYSRGSYLQMDKDNALKRIFEMDAQRFSLLKYFTGKKQCDCVIAVVTGLDTMSHLFCRYFDEKRRRQEPDPRCGSVLRDYYLWLDGQIGEVRDTADKATVILMVSDHSVERLEGLININEWLIHEGYISLREYPSEPTEVEKLKVEWNNTRAWATGTSGQVYVNLKGREVEGIVDPIDYDSVLDELISRLKEISDEKGNALKTRVFKRHEIYSGPFAQYAPDLFVFFDEGRWKANTTVGFGSGTIHSFDPPQRQDDGADAFDGYFCLVGPRIPPKGKYEGAALLDVAPTVLDVMDQKIPGEMEGVSLSGKERTSEEEEALVQERLKFLGY